jgi:hypothetical protein
MGHPKVTTTLAIHTHLFDDDHADTMAALELRASPPVTILGERSGGGVEILGEFGWRSERR